MTEEENRAMCIGELVIEEARRRFEVCGAEDDFYIQSVGPEVVIFGGYNRVAWSPRNGWSCSRNCNYCTERFIREWNAHYS